MSQTIGVKEESMLDDGLLAQGRIPEPPTSGIEYKIASNRLEREQAFRLVYQAYTITGLIEPNEFGMRVTPYHLLPTTEVFIAIYQGQVICTVSLIGDGELGVPLEAIYPREVAELREQGIRFGEVSCLADRRREFSRILPVFSKLNRVLAQYARAQGIGRLLIAVHPRHARFYGRYMGFEQIGGLRSYPTVRDNPAVACCLDFNRIDRERPACYDQFFGEPIPVNQLCPQPMSDRERAMFGPVAATYAGCVIAFADQEPGQMVHG